MIPFNKVHITGDEIKNINNVLESGKIAGDGYYTKACEAFFEKNYGFKKVLLTPSCTDALELAALLIDIKQNDEVIMPSYSFVSMANAFVLRGAKIVFADSEVSNPNIDAGKVEKLITAATKAIVAIHYGGMACNILALKKLAEKHGIYLIEDAAHAIDAFYNKRPLGSFGHLATFSFHETKNISCGEGGLLIINDKKFIKRAEIMRDKGTNRASFIKERISRYNWIDIGSSFLLPEVSAAFLYAQLGKINIIQAKRKKIWNDYLSGFEELVRKKMIAIPAVINKAAHNSHIFYIVCQSNQIRDAFIAYLLKNNIQSTFHYSTLHDSPYYKKTHGKRALPMAKHYQDCLVRLPLFYDLDNEDIKKVISLSRDFFMKEAQ